MSDFPTLFDVAKTGRTKVWNITVNTSANKSLIVTTTGFVGGKMQQFVKEIRSGKNLGKANATTHQTQALAEAESKWKKQKDKGYTEREGGKVLKTTTTTTGSSSASKPPLPMLALDFSKRGKDIAFPAYVQPKVDGIRAVFYKGKLYSRTGKPFPHLDFITTELKNSDIDGVVLDGELYSDELTFQEITGIVRKQKLKPEDIQVLDKIKYVVYDMISEFDYMIRNEKLRDFFAKHKFKHVQLLQTDVINSASDVKKMHDAYISKGYEGLMIRNFTGPYETKNRSKNLQKYKMFQDSEYLITGFTEGEGKEKGMIVFECVTPEGKIFHARPAWTYAERTKAFKKGESFIGKMLTVKYFELSDDLVPRFPVALEIRDYE
jgi:ATP-dependent DNA ligase